MWAVINATDEAAYLKERLVTLPREEELKWYERAKVKTLLEGDANTRFFHLVANGKHRKQHIYKLENDQGTLVGDTCLNSHITNYYKNLFGQPEHSEITLVEDHISDIPQVSQEENDILISPFTESEVRDAIFQMEHNKAPGRTVSLQNSFRCSGELSKRTFFTSLQNSIGKLLTSTA